ncbi:MAG: tRNA (adenosine(37)-N6)-threonylcarbamoyltransferase complex dimerization subunit type 1 TsaB [Synergistaceae bacterium]|jgi:tRNA threonylcarbamoyladenosine biosynthesis protein TsaB|nr:tRNA (adenosine(37)-N6)-threonylcarbamoyltransferase complex dimerization subunit type 1 TsaB [Synergistaceae bacterium]
MTKGLCVKMSDLILALDCSLRWTNVAVLRDGDIFASKRLDIGRRQAAELPLVVESALSEANGAFGDVGLVAVTNGPGYFTGIRVGASYAAALAYGLGVKVAPVSTLHMLAYSHILQSRPVLALVYAGRGRAYAASFGCARHLNIADLPAGEYGGDQLAAWLSSREGPGWKDVFLVSDDPGKAVENLWPTPPQPVLQAPPDASVVAKIAWNARESGDVVSPMELKIFYHRDPQVG